MSPYIIGTFLFGGNMIKRIIFDQDNTLMIWKTEYDDTYKYALDELGVKYSKEELDKLIDTVNNYEKYYDVFDKKNMADLINDNCIIKVPSNFVDVWMKYLCNCYCEEDKSIIPTLEYLSKKYELVILSNWFSYSQIERLKKLGIDKYFTEMIFTDKVKNKPNKDTFIKACGSHKPEECIMVGDSMNIDINGAINAGLRGILLDPKGMYEYNDKIKSIKELEEIL